MSSASTARVPPAPEAAAGKKARRTQAERRQATQEKLVQGAITLLKAKRYAGFRTSELSAVAGVSKGAQTHHFPTKDELVLLALEEVYRRTSEASRARIAAAEPTPDGLVRALVEDSTEFFLGEDFLMSLDLVMVTAAASLGERVRKLAQQYRIRVEEEWREAFIAAGCTEEEAETIIWITFAVGRGLGIRQVMSGPSPRFRQVLEQWGGMAKALVDEPAPPPRAAAKKARKR